jgi:hypothetical protein
VGLGISADLTVATFTDPAGADDATDYSADINWGDAQSSAGTIAFDATSGIFSVHATHAYDAVGVKIARVTIHHGIATDAIAVSTVHVVWIPTLTSLSTNTANEGTDDLSLTVTGSNFAANAQVRWNGVPLATTWLDAAHLQTTIPAADLAEEGVQPIDVLNPGPDGSPSNSLAFTVADAPIAASGTNIVIGQGVPFSGTVAALTDGNSKASPSDVTVTITWGDGQSALGAVSASGGALTVHCTHTYPSEGDYDVQITVVDIGGSRAYATTSIHVTRNGPPPSVATTVAAAFAHSQEAYSRFITAAYQRYLGRVPDTAGLSGWVLAMQHGLTDEQLEAGFIGSPEYIQKHGGQGAGWIRGMYHDLLGRTPADAEVNNWNSALQRGMAPSDIAYGFAASAERECIRVQADYQRYLSRPASQKEVAGWVLAFTSHSYTNEDVIAGFVGAPEYFQRHYDNIDDWLFSVYADVLGRTPDAAGLAAWLVILQNG